MEGTYATLFTDIVVIFLLSVILLLILFRVKIPSVVGFLITGIIVGPAGLEIIQNQESIEFFAELGVIFLLFTIGLEFSISHILKSKQFVLIGGTIQVFLTILICTALMILAGWSLNQAIFIGMLISLSSTAIVMKILVDRQEVSSPHGRAALGILIFQDLIVIPMMMITPILGGDGAEGGPSMVNLILGGILIIAVVYLSSRYVIPFLLHYAARLRNREMFMFVVIGTCLLIAYLTASIGLSMALGAFLAGLIISESEYSMHAMYNMIPFRDMFSAFFFISIGMIFDISYLLAHPVVIGALVIAIILVKYATGTIAAIACGLPARSSVVTSLSICQVGEFAFILATTGATIGILTSDMFQLFLDVSIVTMGLAPLLIGMSGRISPGLSAPLHRIIPDRICDIRPEETEVLKDHIIIVGYGLNGRNVARSARAAGVPYRIIEMNPDTVRDERKKGECISYGDAAQPEVLEKAGVYTARILVVVVNDPFATQQTVRLARSMNPGLYIIARTRYMGEVATLMDLGADDVIPEEFETSIEIFTRILHKYLIPEDEIERLIHDIRSGGYQMLRSASTGPVTVDDLRGIVPDIDTKTIRIPENSHWIGTSLIESQLRSRYSVTVVAIRRGARVIINPSGNEKITAQDVLMVIGRPDDILRAFPPVSEKARDMEHKEE